ncbi:MAG: hypothetical protein Q7T86_11580 [Hyphomicrobiaceae bacterium]|nr:hypothetical protein [Hyphomicrobiaceae bacterium]
MKMKRRDFIKAATGVVINFSWCASALGQGASSDPETGGAVCRPLRIGAGGWLAGIDFAHDGTLLARTDTFGAYLWDESSAEWHPLVTARTMPAEFVNVDHGAPPYELVVAPNDSNIFWMFYLGSVMRSDNRGKTWKKTAFAEVQGANGGDDFRALGPSMAVDPRDPQHLIVGTPQNGLFRTTDGGNTFSQAQGLPASTVAPGIPNIIFDPSSVPLGKLTSVVYCAVNGAGVFQSSDAGLTWSRTSGGPPSHVSRIAVATDGAVYCTAGDAGIWRFAGGAWTNFAKASNGTSLHSVCCDPKNANRIVVGATDGQLMQSLDRGATWSGLYSSVSRTAADIPWLAWSKEDWMSNGDVRFHPTIANKLYFAEGIGVWTTDLPPDAKPSSHTVSWLSQSNGIEQLVANQVVSPPGGNPVLAAWDRPIWYVTDPDKYPSTHQPDNRTAILHCWALDYASSDPKCIVSVIGRQQWWAGGEPDVMSGLSLDGGRTWKPFDALPPWEEGNGMGTIAASTPTNFVWVPTHSRQPYYTTDGGASWLPVELPGVDKKLFAGLHWAFYLRRHVVSADRVTPNVFYLCHTNLGLFRSPDGGVTWTHVYKRMVANTLNYNMKLRATPGHAGHLWLTGGHQGDRSDAATPAGGFYRSRDGGESWDATPDVIEVYDFGFGKSAPGRNYPTIFIYGWVNRRLGLYRSDDEGVSWTYLLTWPADSLDLISCLEGDKNEFGKVYLGFAGSGFAYVTS